MRKNKKQKTREPQVSETIKEKFIKYFEVNKHLKLVFENRRQMCPDANTCSFEEFLNKYWWKKLNNYISGKFKRDIRNTWKGVTKDNFFAWYLDKMKNGCYYCEQDSIILALSSKKRKFPEKPHGKPRRFLEVDRLNNDNGYEKSNCVLACYPCNNAKSDVFDESEFRIIGKAIRRIWKEYQHKLFY